MRTHPMWPLNAVVCVACSCGLPDQEALLAEVKTSMGGKAYTINQGMYVLD